MTVIIYRTNYILITILSINLEIELISDEITQQYLN